jgi:hypothetical protein
MDQIQTFTAHDRKARDPPGAPTNQKRKRSALHATSAELAQKGREAAPAIHMGGNRAKISSTFIERPISQGAKTFFPSSSRRARPYVRRRAHTPSSRATLEGRGCRSRDSRMRRAPRLSNRPLTALQMRRLGARTPALSAHQRMLETAFLPPRMAPCARAARGPQTTVMLRSRKPARFRSRTRLQALTTRSVFFPFSTEPAISGHLPVQEAN